MVEIKNKKIEKIIKFFKKIPRILAMNIFLVSLISFFIALILTGLIFFRYYISVQKQELIFYKKDIEFNEQGFQNVLNFWKEREKKFQEADSKTYYNPFLID